MTDHRNFQRINFRAEADIHIADIPVRFDLVDLALQGSLFRSEKSLDLQIGERAKISIFLPDSSLRLEFSGELIHQHESYYGFLFTEVSDETMGHLRRLLELNFGDGDLADEEFAFWLKKGTASN